LLVDYARNVTGQLKSTSAGFGFCVANLLDSDADVSRHHS